MSDRIDWGVASRALAGEMESGDRSLVTPIDGGGRSPAIVRSIIGLCHSLGLQVTAEGVERPGQLGVLLTDRGVQVQGYLVSRPISAATVPVFVEQAKAHLEQLMIAAPPPQDFETSTFRLRTLRASSTRSRRAARPPADEGGNRRGSAIFTAVLTAGWISTPASSAGTWCWPASRS